MFKLIADIKNKYNFVSQSTFIMTTENRQHLEAINDIREMMKKSTRFLSLSGLSGIFAGIYALVGAFLAHLYFKSIIIGYERGEIGNIDLSDVYFTIILICAAVLILSVITAFLFSNRKAKKDGHTLFDHTAIRVLINLCIPLFAGGIFCIALLYNNAVLFIAPTMLLFYGLALINASKYTYDDIRYFGICEIVLGLINAFNLENSLVYWSVGFGLLHIVYGAVMWFKYERKN